MTTMLQSRSTLAEVPCPICGDENGVTLFDTMDYAFRCTEDRFALKRCRTCGCGYLSPRPRQEDLGKYYPAEYYWSWEGVNQSLEWPQLIERRRQQLEAKAQWLTDLPPGRLLDIGAQKGEFIWYMQQRGWRVEGVEIDNAVPNPAGLPIHYGDFLDLPLEEESYDCITLWAVLEHVYEPARIVARASRLLRRGGRIIILVTNLRSIQARWYRADDYPRHLTIFTKASLARLLRQYGLRLDRSHTGQEIFGGALNGGLVYAVKRLGGYTADEAFAEWKSRAAPDLFWGQWRGRYSAGVRWISRLDRVLTWPLEVLFDKLGFGFILTVSATKD